MEEEPFKVLFCGRGMAKGFEFTKEALAGDAGVLVAQCDADAASLASAAADADVLVPLMTPVGAALLDAAPRLRLVLQFGAGVEAIDAAAAARRGVWVSNIPSGATPNAGSCAEMAVYLTLALLRRQHEMAACLAARRLGAPLGRTLRGQRVLVVGWSHIARALVALLAAFGAAPTALRARGDRWRAPRGAGGGDEDAEDAAAQRLLVDRGAWGDAGDAARLAGAADVVVLACRQDAATRGMVGAAFLARLKRGALLVNVSRGGLLDRPAVEAALADGTLGGLGLDVWWDEPADPSDPLARDPRVVLTPHVAGVTEASYRAMAGVVEAEARRARAGLAPTVRLNAPRAPRVGGAAAGGGGGGGGAAAGGIS